MINKIVKLSLLRQGKFNSKKNVIKNNKNINIGKTFYIPFKQQMNVISKLSLLSFKINLKCPIYAFSTSRNAQVQQKPTKLSEDKTVLQDWQYVREISQSIKASNLQNAFNLIIKSYFNNQILDIQTYHSVHLALLEQTNLFSIQYHEVLYKIYRSHFQPHLLMQEWMNKLIQKSKDNKIRQILQADYLKLGLQIPLLKIQEKKSQQNQKNQKKHRKTKKRSNKQQEQTQGDFIRHASKEQQKQIQNIYQSYHDSNSKSIKFPNLQFQTSKKRQNQINSGQFKINPSISQIQSLMDQIFKHNSKIIFHNVQINYESNAQHQQEQTTSDDEYFQNDYYREDHENDNIIGQTENNTIFDISSIFQFTKISIGKLQLIARDNNCQDSKTTKNQNEKKQDSQPQDPYKTKKE